MPYNDPRYKVLIEVDNALDYAHLKDTVRYFDNAKFTEVMLDTHTNPPGHGQFVTEEVLPELMQLVASVINNVAAEQDADSVQLKPIDHLTGEEQWRLMRMAIDDWGYLWNPAWTRESVKEDWRNGRLDFLMQDP